MAIGLGSDGAGLAVRVRLMLMLVTFLGCEKQGQFCCDLGVMV